MGFPLATKKKSEKNKLRPGTYTSEVISVAETEDYRAGDAYTVTYQFSQGDKSYTYHETFVNDPDDSRCAELKDYLAKNGIELTEWDQLLGLREEVQLLKESKGKRGVFLNIVDRRVLE